MKNSNPNFKVEMKLVKMQDIKFNDDLFIPIKTKTIVDSVLSTEGGLFPGTNTVVIGDPGVGKSTVLLVYMGIEGTLLGLVLGFIILGCIINYCKK